MTPIELWPPRLTRRDIVDAARNLGVEPAALRAVADVESSGDGFLPDGRPKILLEGHILWQQLRKRGIDPVPLHAMYPTIVYPTWTTQHYYGGAREYVRYHLALSVHAEAAVESTSWGLFQMMGFNWKACGFQSIAEFKAAHKVSERLQLDAVCRWMKSNGLANRLAAKDWEGFTRGYNGPGQVPVYSARLRAAYQKRVAEGWNA